LHDNELYSDEIDAATSDQALECISLFIFDTMYFHPQPSTSCPKEYDTVWCGPHAAQATIDAVEALRQKLRSIGGELLVRVGDPTLLIPQLLEVLKVDEIVFGEEPGTYERSVTQQLQQHVITVENRWDSDGNPVTSASPSWYPSI